MFKDLIEVLNQKDLFGNKIECDDDGNIFIVLAKDKRKRNLGRIRPNGAGELIYCKWVDEKNILRKANSWGLNWTVYSCLPENTKILLTSKNKTYSINKAQAESVRSFLWFKKEGFEKQVFINLQDWNIGGGK